MARATQFEHHREFNKLGKPVDHGEMGDESPYRERLL
jgi:predicted metalloendopeptidase